MKAICVKFCRGNVQGKPCPGARYIRDTAEAQFSRHTSELEHIDAVLDLTCCRNWDVTEPYYFGVKLNLNGK